MDLTNEFTVPVPVERAWEVLNDVELIAPCLPGAQLQEIEGDEYRGIVKVKVGPITAQYKGAAVFLEQDIENRKIVLKAGGRDTRGQGSADAVITATMTESATATGVETHVLVESDVTIKGKVAQFGRGMIADVSAKLLTEFVGCLEGKLEGGTPAAASVETPGDTATETAKAQVEDTPVASNGSGGADTAPAAPTIRKIEHAETAPVDLLDTAGAPIAKRVAPFAVLLFILILLGRRRSTKRRR